LQNRRVLFENDDIGQYDKGEYEVDDAPY